MFLPEAVDGSWRVHGGNGSGGRGCRSGQTGQGTVPEARWSGTALTLIRCGLEQRGGRWPGPRLAGRGGDGLGPLFETGRLTAWEWGRREWASREVTVVSGNTLLEEKGKTQRTQQGSLQLRVILASES